MEKVHLLNLISEIKANDDIRITRLNEYLDQIESEKKKEKQTEYQSTHIYFYDFHKYLLQKYGQEDVDALFSDEFFSNETSEVTSFFKKFKSSIKMEKTLPKDLRLYINNFFDSSSLISLARTSHFFNDEIKNNPVYWRPRFIELQCQPECIDRVLKKRIIKDYRPLCQTLGSMRCSVNRIDTEWEFYLMSADLSAIEFAIKKFNINESTKNRWNENAAHLVTFSGNVPALKFLLDQIPCNLSEVNFSKHNLLHLATWSGSVAMIKYIRWLFYKNEIPYNSYTKSHVGDAFYYVDMRRGSLTNTPEFIDQLKAALTYPIHKIIAENQEEKKPSEHKKATLVPKPG